VKRSTAAALFGILLLAVIVRVWPLLDNMYWGSDVGEYYALTRALAEDGSLPRGYMGWGVAYPYFPGLFVVNGAFVLAGMAPSAAVSGIVPVLAALGVLPMFLMAARVTGDDRAGLLAAAFLAVLMFHVFPTSHAIPAALGDFLLLGALLLFLLLPRAPNAFPLLVLAGLAVVATHHFATYALLLFCAATLVLRALLHRGLTVRDIRRELAFVGILAGTTLAYWAWYATPIWTAIIPTSSLSGTAVIALAASAVLAPLLVIQLRRRTSWRFVPRIRDARAAGIATGLAFATSLAFVVVTATASVPGTSLRVDFAGVPLYLPMLAFIALSAAGRRTMDLTREGVAVTAWFVALCGSLVLGLMAAPIVHRPARQLEYFSIPFAIMVGAGFRWVTLGAEGRTRFAATAIAVLLIAASALASYPPPAGLGHREGIDARTVQAALWLRAQGGGLVAADHRVSTVVFGFGGEDATWDREARFWHTTNLTDALAAMDGVPLPRGTADVEWIVIDADTREGVMLSPFEPALPLAPAEEVKFTGPPFHKLFDSGFAQVYWLNRGLA